MGDGERIKNKARQSTEDLSLQSSSLQVMPVRRPVKFYKAFEKHGPDEMKKPEAPFYLAVKQKGRADDQIW